MNLTLAGILGGVGQAGQALAQDREKSAERQRQAARDALTERQVTIQENQYADKLNARARLSEEAKKNPALAPYAGLLGIEGGEALVSHFVKAAEKARELEAARRIGSMIPGSEDTPTMAFTSPEEDSGMQPAIQPADPRAKLMRDLIESGQLPFKESLPFLWPESKPVSETTTGFRHPVTGEITPVPRERQGFTPPPGYVPRFTQDKRGDVSTTWSEAQPTDRGQRNEALAAEILKGRGFVEGTQAWKEGMFVLTNPTPPVPDVGIFSRLDLIGKGGQVLPGAKAEPRLAVDKRLTPEEAGSLGVPYGTTRSAAQGSTPLLAAQRTKMDAQNAVMGIIDKLERDVGEITMPSGALGRVLGTPGALIGVYGQTDAKRAALHTRIKGTYALIVRALGEVGTLTEGDIQRAAHLQPVLAPIPDSAEVVAEKMKGLRELVLEVASRTGRRLDAPVTLGGPAGIGNTTAPPQSPAAQGQQFQSLPPAAQFSGKTMRDTTSGKRYRSDGQRWQEIQ